MVLVDAVMMVMLNDAVVGCILMMMVDVMMMVMDALMMVMIDV